MLLVTHSEWTALTLHALLLLDYDLGEYFMTFFFRNTFFIVAMM